ncbi:C6 zinc finger domain-containing protein [Pleurostoma richardsiae]|uniref:C6 zinc finger domain-containing protein n=1 Tax=Pleurostoma richardsiae TaxID=41990 RepID=A0AA38VH41_9PEZI|nr:C6 zinc finger domain-containing protein [Pleurostoma richardsiae]
MPRLGYTKSRNGCRKCRQRRVKCDEKRPCGACTRHGVPCSLVEDSTTSPEASQSGTPLPSTSKGTERRSNRASSGDPSGSARTLFGLDPAGPVDTPAVPLRAIAAAPSASIEGTPGDRSCEWVTDMELMHHYATKAYLTLPRTEEVARVWQIEVIELALLYKYLLHLALAYSAFHLAYLRPAQQVRYSYVAAHHQDLGLRDMRTALPALNAENCHALFMAGSLLAIGRFAALTIYAGDKDDERPNLEDIVDVFILLKGMNTVLAMWEKVIQTGHFNELFRASRANPESLPFLVEVSERLHQLRKQLRDRLVDQLPIATSIDSELLRLNNISQQAIDNSSDPELRIIMFWPITLSDTYIQMLRDRSPPALVVLGYYCVLVHMTESKAWFTRGWAPKLLRAIEAALPPEWTVLIDWPLEHIHNHTP